ncbi:MAG TPA: ATP-binding cassette domain-containing protein [bacterium]|nr:ATP-binding cassette domain-containing protein [bacterium]
MNVLEVQSVTKRFSALLAVDRLSFSIQEGRVFGLLGPNGAGKTTTIRMIMHIIIPDEGKVSVLEKTDPVETTNLIGYLPEERGLYRKMKVGDILFFLCSLKGLSRSDARPRIDSWLERLDLLDWKNKKLEELSKGMQQKLLFIGTVIHDPKLLILDEPFMGLDPVNTQIIKDILLEQKKRGTSIIFSTHLMDNAEKLCDDILLINHGRDVLSGKLSEVKNRFGRKNIIMEFDGDDAFLQKIPGIIRVNHYGRASEIVMDKSADPQQILKAAAKNVAVRKFEIKEPSLNDIFIETMKSRKDKTA